MIFWVLLLTTLLRAASSLSLPSINEFQRRAAAGIGIAVVTALPLSAHAMEVVKIDADIPALIQTAKDNKDVVLKLVQQTASAVHITKLPSNLVEFARDAAAGDIFLEINGFPVDVSLLSEKGAIDMDISTAQGDISLTVVSKVLPKLPFFSKRVVPLSSVGTGATTTSSVGAVEVVEPAVPQKSLLDKPFFLDPLRKGWTNLQVLGSTALGLGAAYAGSYAYYVKSAEEEERAAQERKEAAAAKNKESAKKAVEANEPVNKVARERKVDVVAERPAKDTSKVVVEKPKAEETTPAEFSITTIGDRKEKKRSWKFWEK